MTPARVVVSAPGKLMLAGEYAVLWGAEAWVAAVGRRAWLHGSTLGLDGSPPEPGSSPESKRLPPEAVLSVRRAEQRLGVRVGELTLDVMQLREGTKKIGLGSSAAAAAAGAGLVFACAGRALTDESTRALVLEDALEGHRSVAPEGSGVDVASSVYGGFLRARRTGDGLEVHPTSSPKGLALSVVWTGVEARTSTFLAHVRAFEARDEAGHRARMLAMGRCAEELVADVIEGDVLGIIEGAREYGAQMLALGREVGVDIVTPEHARITELARIHGGSAKPSGAGGGDVAVAFFEDGDARRAFEHACTAEGFFVPVWELGAEGVRVEHGQARED